MDPTSRIFVAGAGAEGTLYGRALPGRLRAQGFTNVVGAGDEEPDLRDRSAVDDFFARARPEYVFLAAGKTAGIIGNQRFPADLMLDNLLIASTVIPAAWAHGVRKLLYLSSSCTYPRAAAQPLDVSSLWSGALEPTSAAYAVAKLAGIKLCDAYRQQYGARFVAAIAADAYGPGDDFSPENSHVAGALIRRIHEARVAVSPTVVVWGSGAPRREFIFVDDLADACVFAMRHYEGSDPINLGTGTSTSIAELADLIREVTGYRGALEFDRSKPDGMPFKGLDSSALKDLGWRPRVDLSTGLARTYDWFIGQPAVR
jgi:GDP-L-fucose synthase